MSTPSAIGRVAANNVIVKRAGLASLAAKALGSGGRAAGGAARLGGRAALGAAKVPLKGYGKLWSKAGPAGKLGLTAGTALTGHLSQDAIRAGITSPGELQDVIKHKARHEAVSALQRPDILSKQRGGVNPILAAGTSPGLMQYIKSPFRTRKAYGTSAAGYEPEPTTRRMTAAELAKLPTHDPTTGAPLTHSGKITTPTETYQQKAQQAIQDKLKLQGGERSRAYTGETGEAIATDEAARKRQRDIAASRGYDPDIVAGRQGEAFTDPLGSPAAAGAAAAGATGPGTPTAQILAANDPLPVMKIKLEARQLELLGIIAAAGGGVAGAPTPAASEATQELEQLRRIQQAAGRIGEDEKKQDKAVDNRTIQELNWDFGQ